jgi:signal transduction histidine kinase
LREKAYGQPQRKTSLLFRYSADLGQLIPRQRSEHALRAAAMESALASRAKSEFLANMSHELRTPLNAIIGFSDLIERDATAPKQGPKSEKVGEYAGHIHRAGQHLLGIISDILDISKIESGSFELNYDRHDIGEIVEGSVSLIRARAAAKKQTLDIKLPPGLPEVVCDSRRIKQVLLNLLSNANKFTPDGGTITLIAASERSGAITFAVTDTGIGMTPEQTAHALKAFAQVDSGYARLQEGTGLGLPLAKALVEQHGGRFVIHSAPDAGTTVAFTLPNLQSKDILS